LNHACLLATTIPEKVRFLVAQKIRIKLTSLFEELEIRGSAAAFFVDPNKKS
jgi:hypothetical protein